MKLYRLKQQKYWRTESVILLTEVCAEIIYVLEKVYKVPRQLINDTISTIIEFPNITSNKKIIVKAYISIQ